ncbi:isoprenylcysteine carboxylmethyltransferase family protein [Parvibaculum sp.]|uniref:methyltransferase family protein n=1 Tax=Parvibaculum sp. TaxID=2024848 RepID=UPI002C529445|nr:isoprenylcysteine carboxylmethyltransferase family protein [Parvibaculum sp.]HUD52678.1 isoprenylcysteine carboxylmethyltransferase family protein [Parvibaculum sp.]
MHPALLLISAWALWGLSWFAAAVWTGRTENRVPRGSAEVWLYRTLVTIGLVLLYYRTALVFHMHRLWHVGYDGAYVLAFAAIAGFLFTWWARVHLGRLWSGAVTRKEGHYVVDTGPYGIVRHPIYTGILAATLATALTLATIPALLGLVFITVGLWLKAKIEERFLAAELGPDAYGDYRRRVPMLVPFGPKGA